MNKDTKYAIIYLVRHGETEWNTKKLIQGHSDSPLTNNGVDQANKLAKRLEHIKFDAIFSSDLLRAKRTAEILKLERDLVINTTHLLRERNYDELEGKTWEDIRKDQKELMDKFEALSEEEKKSFKYTPNSESDNEIVTRLITILREVALIYLDKTVLIVTHGGILRTFLKRLDPELMKDKAVGNGAYIKLRVDGMDFFVEETEGLI